MTGSLQQINTLGGATAVYINVLLIILFIARFKHTPSFEYVIGLLIIVSIIPLSCLLVKAIQMKRPLLYFIQIGLMILYLIIELFLDYVLKINFRGIRWMTITYVTLFFAGTGGMIGVASHAGTIWTIASVITFFIMGILAFVQRAVTGL